MKFKKTTLSDVFIITLDIHKDNRGNFSRTYCQKEFNKHGIKFIPVQTNESYTLRKGTIRGLHFQSAPHQEAKIVSCVKGKIFDVIVDLRKNSPTYLKWVSIVLSDKAHNEIYIPKGCAHGFQTLTKDCIVQYFMSEYYYQTFAKGIKWNDPLLSIPWPIKTIDTISKKDSLFPYLKNL